MLKFINEKTQWLVEDGKISWEEADFREEADFFVERYKNNEPIHNELDEFLKFVIPKNNGLYHLMIMDTENKYSYNYMLSYNQFISSACALAIKLKYTLFYNNVSFNKWCNEDDTISDFRSFYIDIDDFDCDVDVYSMNRDELITFLKTHYNLPEHLLPNRIVLSGRGMHIYYQLQPFHNKEKREYYMKHLLTYFSGDFTCLSVCHQIRVPFSFNTKNGVQKSTKLIKIHDKEFSIDEFDYFIMSKKAIELARKNTYDEINKKKQAAKAKNKAEKQLEINNENDDFCADAIVIINTDENVNIPSKKQKKAPKKVKKKSLYNDKLKEFDPNEFHYYNFNCFFPNHQNRNLLLDLNNFYYRHEGDLSGKRDKFAFIYANYASRFMNKADCIEELQKYFDNSFFDELFQIIDSVYNRNKTYNYKYTTIAEMLEFTQTDIDASYCNFSEERKDESLKNKYKRKNDKRNEASREQKEQDIQIFKKNINLTNKEICQLLNNKYSIRTIQRWRLKFASN